MHIRIMPKEFRESFQSLLPIAYEQYHVTRAEAARRLGVRYSTLWRLEIGKTTAPSRSLLERLCRLFPMFSKRFLLAYGITDEVATQAVQRFDVPIRERRRDTEFREFIEAMKPLRRTVWFDMFREMAKLAENTTRERPQRRRR